MNNFNDKLTKKKEELKKMVDQHSQYQKSLQELTNNILVKNGEIKQLNELLDETKKGK